MFLSRIRTAALGLAAAFSVSACGNYYDDGYGYGGVSVGYGTAGYYDPYYDDYYYGSRYGRGYGYGSGYGRGIGGWYDGFYYPGTGFYIYDRFGTRSRWNDRHRGYWQGRGSGLGRHFRREERQFLQHRRDERQALRRGEVTRDQFRQHRREERRTFREHRRSHRRGNH